MVIRERRRAGRVVIGLPLDEIVDDIPHRCHATSLSGDGIYIERNVSRFRRRTNKVQVVLPLPDGAEGLWARAEVVYDCFRSAEMERAMPSGLVLGTALRFTYIPEKDRARLVAFLSRRHGGELASASSPLGRGTVQVVRPGGRAPSTVS